MLFLAFRSFRHVTAVASAFAALCALPSGALADTTDTYSCTHGPQTSTAPFGAVSATVTLDGAAGQAAMSGQSGGLGESLVMSMPVTPGQQFDVEVGCQGNPSGNGGYNGGASSGAASNPQPTTISGGGGGGASDILPLGGSFSSLYAIAGGGGGGGRSFGPSTAPAGYGGNAGVAGQNGSADNQAVGGGGGQSGDSGGAGGQSGAGASGSDGAALQGGAGGLDFYEDPGAGDVGGGGGGGWIGGGGGAGGGGFQHVEEGGAGGGGGGSSYVASGVTQLSSTANVTGDGSITIVYSQQLAAISAGPSPQDFGSVITGQSATRSVTVTDSGGDTLNVGQASVSGSGARLFSLVAGQDGCSNSALSGGQSCTIALRFSPTSPGMTTSELMIPSNGATATVLLNGLGATPLTSRPGPARLAMTRVRLARHILAPCGRCARARSKLSLVLNRAAVLQVTLQRRVHGRWRTVGIVRRSLSAGAHRMALRLRFAGKPLTAGRYRLLLRASSGAATSSRVAIPFAIRKH
jgi:hypothetical protein